MKKTEYKTRKNIQNYTLNQRLALRSLKKLSRMLRKRFSRELATARKRNRLNKLGNKNSKSI